MDRQTLFVNTITAPTIIGIHPKERAKRQELSIDIALSLDTNKASKTDDINDTINYEQLTYDLRDLVMKTSFQLVESLAEHIIHWTHDTHPKVTHIKIKITKQGVFPNAQSYGIIRETTF